MTRAPGGLRVLPDSYRVVVCCLLFALGACSGGSGGSSGASSPVEAPARVTINVSPATSSVQAGLGSQAFTAAVTNSPNTSVTWQVNGISGGSSTAGTISSAGLYTAPASVPSPATTTVTAISSADPGQSGAAQVTITPPVAVTLSPASLSLQAGVGTEVFTATVANSANTAVTWQVNGISGGNPVVGTISSGNYVAPAAVPSPATVTVTATSAADPSRSASAQVSITAPPPKPIAVAISPTVVSLQAGIGTQAFAAAVSNTTDTTVTWSVNGVVGGSSTLGTISTAGLFTAPTSVPSPATVTVAATSRADAGQSGSVQVTITPPVAVTVSPTSASLQAGIGTQNFAAAVTNTANTAVSWRVNNVAGGNATIGTIANSGAYSAPASVPTPATVSVTATSAADPSRSGSALVSITPPVAVTVTPQSLALQAGGGPQNFAATVSNNANTAVSWRVSNIPGGNSAVGTISMSGTYTPPAMVPSPATVTITAVSVADPARAGSAQVTVTAPAGVSVAIGPRQAGLTTSQLQQFAATVTGTTNTAVKWKVDGIDYGNATVGSIDAHGLYAPPANAGVHTVTATSVADASKTAGASVAVTDLTGIATQRYDSARSGQNTAEYALTPQRVSAVGGFGKLFQCGVDGPVYAQPLYAANLAIGGGTHNVLFVATENDSVYAFDADDPECVPYWNTSFLGDGITPVPAEDTNETGDIPGTFGITGTPVIDPVSRTMYVVANTKENGAYVYRLHALDLASGAERPASPVTIQATVGSATFEPLRQLQRPGLLLLNGSVYIAFGSHGDVGTYYGWLMGYDRTTLQQTAAFNTAPDATQSSIWMSGAGPAADADGNIYVSTANGVFDATDAIPPAAPADDFGNSVLKLGTAGGGLAVRDFYAASNQDTLNDNDWDFGSGGVLVLPDALGSTSHPHLAITGDKEAQLFLLDRDDLGRYDPGGTNNIVQTLLVNSGGPCAICGLFSTPAVWRNNVYVGAVGDTIKMYTMHDGQLPAEPTSQSRDTYDFPGSNVVISANGTTQGIAWALDTNTNGTDNGTAMGPAILRAYDATDLDILLWSSATLATDTCGDAVKFVVPTVANGKVYVAGNNQVTVYGLLP